MKKMILAIGIATICFSCNNATTESAKTDVVTTDTVVSESNKTAGDWVPVDSATAMKTMMEAGTPGPQHAMFAKADGKWAAETTMWMSPGAAPIIAKSSATNKMLYDGRFQQTTFKGDFMGMPYEGTSINGYDNVKKVYFTTWMDNMSTAPITMEGNYDESSKTINYKGKMICPANGKECDMREVYKFVDDNTHVMEMYGPDMQTGKEFKSMEIKFTRSK